MVIAAPGTKRLQADADFSARGRSSFADMLEAGFTAASAATLVFPLSCSWATRLAHFISILGKRAKRPGITILGLRPVTLRRRSAPSPPMRRKRGSFVRAVDTSFSAASSSPLAQLHHRACEVREYRFSVACRRDTRRSASSFAASKYPTFRPG